MLFYMRLPYQAAYKINWIAWTRQTVLHVQFTVQRNHTRETNNFHSQNISKVQDIGFVYRKVKCTMIRFTVQKYFVRSAYLSISA